MKIGEFRRNLWDLQELLSEVEQKFQSTVEPSEMVFELVEKFDEKELALVRAKFQRILED